MYGDTIYIFVDEKNTRKPLQYNTVQNRVMAIIQKKTCGMITANYSALERICSAMCMESA